MVKKRVAVYIRVSTQEQADTGYSIPAQKERLVAYCKARDWLLADMYIDGGYSGSNIDRPGIQKLISEINRFDIVLVYKLDRLSRSQKDTLYLIEEIFLPNNVDFVSMNESFDTGTPFGRAMIGILSVFAQLEREQIKERTMMGRIARAKEGKFHGGPYKPIGYDTDSSGHYIINDYEAMQVRKIYDLYLSGMGVDRIAEYMKNQGFKHRYGDWSSASSARGVLYDDKYIGVLRFQDIVVDNAFPPIISIEKFNQAQELHRIRQEKYGSAYKQTSLLSGFIYCKNCGARYFGRQGSNNYAVYNCYSRSSAKNMAVDRTCKNKSWRMERLDAIVDDEIRKLIFDKKYFDKLLRQNKGPKHSHVSERTMIEEKIQDIEKQTNKLMDLYQNDTIPIDLVSSRIEKLHSEKKGLVSQLEKIKDTDTEGDFQIDGIRALLSDTAKLWELADREQKRMIMGALIDKIIVGNESIEIIWTFAKK